MVIRLAMIFTTTVLTACVGIGSTRAEESVYQPSQRISALAVEKTIKQLVAEKKMLWPGFDPLVVPLAVYDGKSTFLFRHPSPPQGFSQVPERVPPTFIYQGRYEAMIANTSMDIGGVQTATLLLESSLVNRSLTDIAAIAIHEAFHVYQRLHHPGWIGNEANLFTYPTDSVSLLALRRLETEALRRALTAKDSVDVACWARRALSLRKKRYSRMDSIYSAYERGTELNEGLASWVEMRAAGRDLVELPMEEYRPTEVRRRAYSVGQAMGLLLDRFKPGWPALLEADDRQTLDAMLAAALRSGNECSFKELPVSGAEQKAAADIADVAAERVKRLAAFTEKKGWSVIVEATGNARLWPQGFDPLNVERIDAKRVLHTRFLRLGNDLGSLHVMGAEALTQGIGAHPLFQGVGRVLVTGLTEPHVRADQGHINIQATGFDLDLKNATVVQRESTITVHIGL